MAVHQFNYKYEEPAKWFEHLSKCFPSTLKDKELFLEKPFGEGRLGYSTIQEGLWVLHLNYRVFKPILMQTLDSGTNDFFLMNFYLSESNVTRTSQNGAKVMYDLQQASILFTSSRAAAHITPATNKWVRLMQVLITKDWLLENVDIENSCVQEFYTDAEPICFSENLDYRLRTLVKKGMQPTTHKLKLALIVYQILDYMLTNFKRREYLIQNGKFHPSDIQRLLAAKSYIEENVTDTISLDKLSKISQMSPTKFKRLFVKLFGKPPYRYHLENKLEKGKELIQLEGLSVSETAYFLGYEDQGSFSKAFKKYHGILPSEL